MTPEELHRKKARFVKNCWAQKYKYSEEIIKKFIAKYTKEKNGTMLYLQTKGFHIGKQLYKFNLEENW